MNQVVNDLLQRLHIADLFTTGYTPWANGTVEIVNRRILFLMKSLLSEFALNVQDWPDLVPLINMVFNHTIRPRIGYVPVTILTGLEPSTLFVTRLDATLDLPITPDRLRELTADLISALDDMHKDVSHRLAKQSRLRHESRKHQRNVKSINFSIDDYVLVAKRSNARKTTYKLDWSLPNR
ncbi:hypothetical protein PBRA_003262 [Plasmodiophora brassicae]|uniref:Integrase catalytic domain-containing protein n=1 Tax=Plasmodiophora brassicae TaxID=37360 RepID=A0A0G4J7X8_PLABS|nr:hypothetical protein PBRA_003262 [Plasmodiophora brassicae]